MRIIGASTLVVLVAIAMAPRQGVPGIVVDPAGAPVAGAVVEAYAEASSRGCCGGPRLLARATSGSDGCFHLPDVRDAVRFMARDGVRAMACGNHASVLRLGASQFVDVTVVDRSGVAVANAWLNVTLTARGLPVAPVEMAARGIDRLGPFAAEYEVLVEARGPGLRPSRVIAQDGRADLILDAGLAMQGRVVDESGAPVGSAIVDAVQGDGFAFKATSAADGSFAIDGLSPRRVRYIVRRDCYEPSTTDEEQVGVVTAVVRRRDVVTGSVLPSRPGLFAVAVVGRARHRVPVAEDGTFRIAGVPSECTITIEGADRQPVTSVEVKRP